MFQKHPFWPFHFFLSIKSRDNQELGWQNGGARGPGLPHFFRKLVNKAFLAPNFFDVQLCCALPLFNTFATHDYSKFLRYTKIQVELSYFLESTWYCIFLFFMLAVLYRLHSVVKSTIVFAHLSQNKSIGKFVNKTYFSIADLQLIIWTPEMHSMALMRDWGL